MFFSLISSNILLACVVLSWQRANLSKAGPKSQTSITSVSAALACPQLFCSCKPLCNPSLGSGHKSCKKSLSEKKITLFVSLQWVALIVELLWCSQTYIKTFQPIFRLFSVLLIPNYTINPLASLIFLSLIGAAHLIPVNNYCLCDGIETYPAKGKLPELWWEYLSTTVLLVFTSLPSAPHNAERKSMPHIRVHFLWYGGKVM